MSVLAMWAWGVAQAQPAAPAPGAANRGVYDFAYRIEGDKRVAPVQVFDDGRQTYMQFRVGQILPAIFTAGPQEERLAAVAWQGGYAVVAGTAREFTLRIGDVVARARYEGRASQAGMDGGSDMGAAAAQPAYGDTRAAPSHGARAYAASAGLPRGDMFSGHMPAGPAQAYEATPADRTMRQALARWAKASGWTFESEHWTVDVDIPLAGAASLGSDFKTAVRALLASTELSSRPLQPCFYSNRVLRIIPFAESCDRTAQVSGQQG
ncbi:TcpQ domain-containing protein [Pigmentiphaga sp. NML080357]|uniref:TcpQ domain-containing protein n=1 Tax=Pigmentiphaga sp. NML080357 TaxID=2008675 RepID=UPI0013037E5C|nr:TcpQ domain-containing protein [Pigmentiphaga sp. NML080357]